MSKDAREATTVIIRPKHDDDEFPCLLCGALCGVPMLLCDKCVPDRLDRRTVADTTEPGLPVIVFTSDDSTNIMPAYPDHHEGDFQ